MTRRETEKVIDRMMTMPLSGEVVIGDITLDAMTAQTVREMSNSGPEGKGWVSLTQFATAFGLSKGRGYETMNRLIAADKWETSGRGNQTRYRPISKQKK